MQKKSFGENLFNGIKKRIASIFANRYEEVNINWWRLKYYKHLPPGKIRIHKLFDKSFYFNRPAELIHGFDEIFVDEVYKQELPSSPYIIDCGANIGLSIIYMKRLYPNAQILAFEPDEINFDLLTKNITSFGFSQVELYKEAVWIQHTTLQFSNEGSMGSKIESNPGSNTTFVKAVRLKDYMVREIDFLKMDIEGAEYTVLLDIAEKLPLVNNMFLEYHGSFQQNHELAELISLIDKSGFNYYIKEAAVIYDTPFVRTKKPLISYDVQLNIFCFREKK